MSDMMPAVAPAPLIKVIDGKFVIQDEFKLAKLNLQELAAKITEVTNPDQYIEAMSLVAKGKADVRLIEALAEPEILAARNRLEQLRHDRDAVLFEIWGVVSPVEAMARKWNLHVERPAAKAEEKEINKGVKPTERVIVKPSIPSTGASRIVAHYRSKVIDAKKVKKQFLIPDEKAINAKARKDQDILKTMREVGGVIVWIE
jgi:hypothetical protein